MAADIDTSNQFNYLTAVDAEIPPQLKDDLASKQILDIGEIFWNTRYKYDENASSRLNPPIYKSNLALERWLGLWCRYLALKSSGTFSEIFLGCRGAVRTYSELGHFLLPYLIVDVLQNPPIEKILDSNNSVLPNSKVSITQRREKMMKDILLEITTVLAEISPKSNDFRSQKDKNIEMIESAGVSAFRRNHNNTIHMAIHAIFTLLDTLTRWRNLCESSSGN